MKITPIINQIKKYCPRYQQRVAGGLDWETIEASAKQPLPAAYVIPTGDTAEESSIANGTQQIIRDLFDVCVIVKTKDERGQSWADPLHDIRKELFLALVGFKPAAEYDPIQYSDGELLVLNRAVVVYQYSFFAETQLGQGDEPETWEELELAGLADFKEAHINIDVIDPIADPNRLYPGPDQRIEFEVDVNLEQEAKK